MLVVNESVSFCMRVHMYCNVVFVSAIVCACVCVCVRMCECGVVCVCVCTYV